MQMSGLMLYMHNVGSKCQSQISRPYILLTGIGSGTASHEPASQTADVCLSVDSYGQGWALPARLYGQVFRNCSLQSCELGFHVCSSHDMPPCL